MAYGQDRGEVYLILHQMESLQRSLVYKFVVKLLQVVVSLLNIAFILTFLGEIPWLKKKLRPVHGLW